MRTATLCLIAAGAILVQQSAMADKGGGASDVVKTIKAEGLKSTGTGGWEKPDVIKSADDLAKVFGEKSEGVDRIKKEVDFTKQQVLCFNWSGSGGDKLTHTVNEGKDEVKVEFKYTPGLTRDLKPHLHVFVLPKNAKFTVTK